MSVSSYSTLANEMIPLPGSRHRSPGMAELFAPRIRERGSITADQALIHMVKVMMGTGMLTLPLAFKQAGLWLGLVLLTFICLICIYCTRQLVYSLHYVSYLKSQQRMDYANVMRSAVEIGPPWIRDHGYFWKQAVNTNMFIAQFGFCCVYFVFMADNLKQFFDQTSSIHISQAGWIAMLLIPTLCLVTIRELKALAPLAAVANVVYLVAIFIVMQQLFHIERPSWSLPAVGELQNLPLFFGTIMFAFEGVAVVLPIENQMDEPIHFITKNGVLNTSCLLVLLLYCIVGFFGYLRFGDTVMDTLTLNLPQTIFYQTVKLMFVACILISYPLQFYVPMERVEKWIKRKVTVGQAPVISAYNETSLVWELLSHKRCFTICQDFPLLTKGFVHTASEMSWIGNHPGAMAELIPHLALFISLVGSVAGTSLTLVFPPMIELLCFYSRGSLTKWVWMRNIFLMMFAVVGFATGTYASLFQIFEAFGKEEI